MAQFDRDMADSVVVTESLEMELPVPNPVVLVPAVGPSFGGTLIEILGSGFLLPTPPAASGPTTPNPYDSVVVYFGGVRAERVDVVSPTVLSVRTPLVPPGTVDVLVQNVDDQTGVPIPGQSRVLVGGWTSRLVSLTELGQSDVERVVERLVLMMRAGIMDEVVTTPHVDYSEDGTVHTIALASLPSIVLVGPDMPEDREYTDLDVRRERDGDDEVIKPPAMTVDLIFLMLVGAKTLAQKIRMFALIHRFFERTKWVDIDRDPTDLTLGKVSFELELITRPGVNDKTKPNVASVGMATATVIVKGVPIEETPGYPDRLTDNAHERTGVVDDDGYVATPPEQLNP